MPKPNHILLGNNYLKPYLLLFSILLSNTSIAKTDICAPKVPEILPTKSHALINRVLYGIVPAQETDSRIIGKELVTRLVEKNKSLGNKNLYDFYKDTEIQMSFSDKNFDSIRRSCFRNQFQTKSSKGFASRTKRQKAETTLIGMSIDDRPKVLVNPADKSHHIRPKYAYLVPTKAMDDVSPLTYSESYGNVYAVMKNEVKDRSTFTAQDSLKDTKEALPLKTKDDYKEIRKNKKDYWEAQIWGQVCFSDVAYFMVNCPEKLDTSSDTTKLKNYNRVTDEVFNKMKETGIPVYQCKKEIKGVNTIFTKGEILSKENLSKRNIDEAKVDPDSNFPTK